MLVWGFPLAGRIGIARTALSATLPAPVGTYRVHGGRNLLVFGHLESSPRGPLTTQSCATERQLPRCSSWMAALRAEMGKPVGVSRPEAALWVGRIATLRADTR